MRIVVTGGAGFIGANLVRRLVDDGHAVVVVDDLSTGSESNLAGLDVDFHRGSVLDTELLVHAGRGSEAIVHLAAIPSVPRSVKAPLPSHQANATGTLCVLEAARSLGAHVTVASSSSVYGANLDLPKVESMPVRPISPYAVSKLAAESYSIAYLHTYSAPTIAFRFFNVYGPLQAANHAYAAVIPAFMDAIAQGKPLPIHSDGLQTRDFTFVDSVTEVLALTATRKVTSATPVNLAFGTRHSLLDIANHLGRIVGRPLEREHLPRRAGDVQDSQADNTLLRQLLPEATATPIEAGLRATWQWWQRDTPALPSDSARS